MSPAAFTAAIPGRWTRTVKAATAHGVRIGAHPSYPDLVGFGRRAMAATPDEIYADHLYQLGALDAFCRANGVQMQHVKAHGALNNVGDEGCAVGRGDRGRREGVQPDVARSSACRNPR